MQYVYVLNKHGEPLMPCSPRKARLLLKQKKVYVVKRTPFTIKLLYGSTGYKQPITLGIGDVFKHLLNSCVILVCLLVFSSFIAFAYSYVCRLWR